MVILVYGLHKETRASVNVLFQKLEDGRADLRIMSFERKVTCINEMDFGVRNIPLVGLSARGQKERVVLAPDGEERRLVFSEIALKLRIEIHVACIVEEKVELRFMSAGTRQIKVVERAPIGRNKRFFRRAMHVLKFSGLGCQH